MNINQIVSWPYQTPIFSRASIENSGGTTGLAKAAANLAVWSAGVGLVAKYAGAKHPYRIAAATFVVLVVADLIFGHSQINNGGPGGDYNNPISTGTASPITSINGLAPQYNGAGGGFGDGNDNYGTDGNGFNS